MKRVQTTEAPAAIGPYSQAIVHGGLVFTSGQIALRPGGSTLEGETAAEQARVVFDNLRAVLAAAGTDLDHALKATVFLADIDDYAEVNAVYAEAMGQARPARAAVAVRTLPKGALVEIDLIAAL